ncbi:MAG: hypothetical protein IJ835_02590 [Muribaculaceae bacterium]|nr:hypothetical protein [Muribaculaceae bacterium]
MRKVIAIGESVLDTVFKGGVPIKAMVGGRIACAAATLGEMGVPVTMVSECCRDNVGDIVVNFLERHNVDTHSVDRYTDGTTALAAIFRDEDGAETIVNYGVYPAEKRFDVVWPRIDEDDILLFGSLYAIDLPQRERLFELVKYAQSRKAIIVYLPGFQHGINFRITRVMPAILENLEVADIVVAHSRDIDNIFPGEDSEKAYHNHIEFYCPNYVHLHHDLSLSLYSRQGQCRVPAGAASTNLLGWQAGLTAGIINDLIKRDISAADVKTLAPDIWNSILRNATSLAKQCAADENNCIEA